MSTCKVFHCELEKKNEKKDEAIFKLLATEIDLGNWGTFVPHKVIFENNKEHLNCFKLWGVWEYEGRTEEAMLDVTLTEFYPSELLVTPEGVILALNSPWEEFQIVEGGL